MLPVNNTDNFIQQKKKDFSYYKQRKSDFYSIIPNDRISRQDNTAKFFAQSAKKAGIENTDLQFKIYASNYLSNKMPIPLSLIQKTATYLAKGDKQIFDDDLYFVRMQRYDKRSKWAHSMNGLTYILSYLISSGRSFDEICALAQRELKNLNDSHTSFGQTRQTSHFFTIREDDKYRGGEYYEKYKEKCKDLIGGTYTVRSNYEYSEVNTCSIEYDKYSKAITISHRKFDNDYRNNLVLANKEFNKLREIKNPTSDEINRSIATIHWLIAQQMPFKRGSDSFANLITKAMYHAYGMEVSQIKEGHSFDFEAFFRDLDDFIKIYPDLFEKPPKKFEKNGCN